MCALKITDPSTSVNSIIYYFKEKYFLNFPGASEIAGNELYKRQVVENKQLVVNFF